MKYDPRIKEYLEYNHNTGFFKRKKFDADRVQKKKNLGLTSRRYIHIRILGHTYSGQRLAWWFFYNEIPPSFMHIDHINGDKKDNRISNLRLVTRSENARNQENHRNGKLTGALYCDWCTKKKWMSYSTFGDEKIRLGLFWTEKEAHNQAIKFESNILVKNNQGKEFKLSNYYFALACLIWAHRNTKYEVNIKK